MARSGRARRRLNPLLCGCLSLGPPADVHIAPLLQECGAWETVPALVTIRMMTLLTRNDSTHSALLPTTPLICPPTYRFGCPRPCPRQCPNVLGGTAEEVSKAAPCLVVLVSPQPEGSSREPSL
jgi:hypothetical protein